jgi:hypothetical protein
MKRLPYFRATFNQFMWARIEPDGTCSHAHLQARFGVLGSDLSVGYWCSSRKSAPHDTPLPQTKPRGGSKLERTRNANQKPANPEKQSQCEHGQVLLGKDWPSDREAWSLKNEQYVPLLRFSDESLAPEKPRPGQVKDWTSWYEWRGLSLESPAALMMDYPLSVYHLLVDVLKVVDPAQTLEEKQTLVLHYLSAEVELNFLPL